MGSGEAFGSGEAAPTVRSGGSGLWRSECDGRMNECEVFKSKDDKRCRSGVMVGHLGIGGLERASHVTRVEAWEKRGSE